MATGDITAPTITESGKQIAFTVEGLNATLISGFESGKGAVISGVTSKGYNTSGTLIDVSRPAYTLAFNNAALGGTPDFQDTFSGTVDTNLADHTPDVGTGWTAVYGNAALKSSSVDGLKITATDGTYGFLATCSQTGADATISAVVRRANASKRAGIAFRYADASNHWRATINDADGKVRLSTVVAGTQTDIATGTTVYSSSADHELKVVTNGTSIVLSVNGTEELSITNSTMQSNTGIGLWAQPAIESAFVNRFVSFVVNPGGECIITLDLPDEYRATDTGGTLTIDAEAISDGTYTSNAYDSTFTSDSTCPNPKPTCNCFTSYMRRESGEFYVDVQATGKAIAGYLSNTGIACVEVTATDDDGDGTPVTKRASAMQLVPAANATTGEYASTPAWRVGPFDLAPDGDWGSGGATDHKQIVITAVAKPWIGNADSLVESAPQLVFADASDDYDTHTAYVDNRGTMTIASGLAYDLEKGVCLVGNTSGARAMLSEDAAASTTTFKINHLDGTFTSGEPITFDTATVSLTTGADVALEDGDEMKTEDRNTCGHIQGAALADATTLLLKTYWGTWDADEVVDFYRIGDGLIASGQLSGTPTKLTATLVGSPSFTGDDSTGVVDNIAQPFLTTYKAAKACATANTGGAGTGGSASWSQVILRSSESHQGRYALGKYTFADRFSTIDGPVVFTRTGEETPVVVGTVDNNGIKTHLWRLQDVDWERSGGETIAHQCDHGGATWDTGTTVGNGWASSHINVQHRALAPNRAHSSTGVQTSTQGRVREHIGGGFLDTIWCIFAEQIVARDLHIDGLADAPKPTNGSTAFLHLNSYITLRPDGPDPEVAAHSDVLQFTGSGAADSYVNTEMSWCRSEPATGTQPAPFYNMTNSEGDEINRFAMVGVIQDIEVGNTISQLDDITVNDHYYWCNVFGDGLVTKNAYDEANCSWYGNIFKSTIEFSYTGWRNNHHIAGDFAGQLSTGAGGETLGDLFVDYENDDWTPKGTLLNRLEDAFVPYDGAGTAVPDDGSGAIGALQVAGVTTPTVTTATPTSETSSGATVGGNVTADGGATVTSRGVYWALTSNPTSGDNVETAGTGGTGSYTVSITGVDPETTVYVVAWATNSAGTATGSEVEFTTLAASEGGDSDDGGLVQTLARPLAGPVGGTL